MGYSSYSFSSVKRKFQLNQQKARLFEEISLIAPSEMLVEVLRRNQTILGFNNEKSRSEFLVAPILGEFAYLNYNHVSFYSGENLNVDADNNLNGECDFIFSKVPYSYTIEKPIICLVEAENDNITTGLGQCVAQMLGAQLFNEREGNLIPFIYGCVTTGYEWKFLKLENKAITTDLDTYYLKDVNILLGIFQKILNTF
jgi:hypothetical protein